MMRSMVLALFMAVAAPITVHAVRQTTNGNVRESIALLDEQNNNASTSKMCRDFCVQCADGATIFYGRNRNWWKVVAIPLAAGVGAVGGAVVAPFAVGVETLIFSSLEGVMLAGAASGGGVGTIAGASRVIGDEENFRSTKNQTAEERGMTVTHWYGHLPSSGVLCERLDIVKFHKDGDGNTVQTTLVNKETKGNQLKPYDAKAELKPDFLQEDMKIYKEGCKVVKGSGLTGWKQLSRKAVDSAVLMCSSHSRLCGAAGEATIVPVKAADECGLMSK
eukprot:TRINITY_DN16472_c0_g1_i1.p1 TRINITY_DN16472_c0_g1~~TRINITY_DN16472_c0_g1_i1.p1  ORF type:complete len:277 (-),score=50.91 TRINITY_DN16472_c0_g1_i1:100-930(-)